MSTKNQLYEYKQFKGKINLSTAGPAQKIGKRFQFFQTISIVV